MFLINGYLGYGNYGDELLASIVEKKVQKIYRAAEFKRLSSKDSIFKHFDLIGKCKEFICVGGLFQDKTSIWNSFYYLLTIILAKFFNKRIRIIAQGIGPLNSKFAKLCTYLAFKTAHSVSVRDRKSSDLLKEWKVDHYLGSDLAWLVDYREDKFSNISKAKIQNLFDGDENTNISSNKNLIAISLRSHKQQDDKGLVDMIIDSLPKNYGEKPVLILQMQDEDSFIHKLFNAHDFDKRKSIRPIVVKAKDFEPEELVYLLKNHCESLIGMRLHALILARIAGIEIMPIASDPKIVEFRDQIEMHSVEVLQEKAEKHFATI